MLTYHVVAGNVSSSQLKNNEQVPTLLTGHSIDVEIHPGPRPNEPAVVTLDRYSQVLYVNTYGTNVRLRDARAPRAPAPLSSALSSPPPPHPNTNTAGRVPHH